VPLQGHWERQHAPLRRADRRAVAAAALLVAVVLAWLVLAGGGDPAQAGCVNVTAASTTGGARMHACGADARRWCRSEAGAQDTVARAVRAACRRAGY
jgi:hypothetical protein